MRKDNFDGWYVFGMISLLLSGFLPLVFSVIDISPLFGVLPIFIFLVIIIIKTKKEDKE